MEPEFSHAEEAPSDDSGRLVIDESPQTEAQQEDEGGWETVSNSRRGPRPKFKLVHQNDTTSAYQTVTELESAHPALRINVRPTLTSEYVLTPKDDRSEALLRRLAEEGDRVILLDPSVRRHKVVLERYPITLPLQAVEAHPHVLSATRLRAHRDKVPTRQILLVYEGPPPPKLDLGSWGRYALRPYQGEPVRCYKCQRFGHLQATCQHPVRCGVCSQAHPTEQCIDRHKASEVTTARCPNCTKGHHAWNVKCPERMRRMPQGHQQQQQQQQREPHGHPQQQRNRHLVPAPPPARSAWVTHPPPTPGRPGTRQGGPGEGEWQAASGLPQQQQQREPRGPPQQQGRRRFVPTPPDRPASHPPPTPQRPGSGQVEGGQGEGQAATSSRTTVNSAHTSTQPPTSLVPQPQRRGGRRDRAHHARLVEEQPTALPNAQPPTESRRGPSGHGEGLNEEGNAIVDVILVCVVRLVKRLLDRRQGTAATTEQDLEALLREEMLTDVSGGALQPPPSPSTTREPTQHPLHPPHAHNQDGGAE